jgi:hypothetical protein
MSSHATAILMDLIESEFSENSARTVARGSPRLQAPLLVAWTLKTPQTASTTETLPRSPADSGKIKGKDSLPPAEMRPKASGPGLLDPAVENLSGGPIFARHCHLPLAAQDRCVLRIYI